MHGFILPQIPIWITDNNVFVRQDSLFKAHSFSYVIPSEPHTWLNFLINILKPNYIYIYIVK